jgi:NTP pyrophosphatase (non-canonical NTP hydrolase)
MRETAPSHAVHASKRKVFHLAGRDLGRGGCGSARPTGVDIAAFQDLMARTYGARDRGRGVPATVAWLAEEVGELARAARKGTRAEQLHELGDVLAWLASLAEQLGIPLAEAAERYAGGCPRCGEIPCACA